MTAQRIYDTVADDFTGDVDIGDLAYHGLEGKTPEQLQILDTAEGEGRAQEIGQMNAYEVYSETPNDKGQERHVEA